LHQHHLGAKKVVHLFVVEVRIGHGDLHIDDHPPHRRKDRLRILDKIPLDTSADAHGQKRDPPVSPQEPFVMIELDVKPGDKSGAGLLNWRFLNWCIFFHVN